MGLRLLLAGLLLAAAAVACNRGDDSVIVITATFFPPTSTGESAPSGSTPTIPTPIAPTLAPGPSAEAASVYVVQPGDTLTSIALAHHTDVETLLSLNALTNPDVLEVGQSLALPPRPTLIGPANALLPDGLLVRGPASDSFDAVAFVNAQPGRLRELREEVDGVELPGAEIVERVSREFRVDARVLLALLEYRTRLLSERDISIGAELYPVFPPVSLADFGRTGLYRQLSWAADRLNAGYYGRKYRELDELELTDGVRLLLADGLGAGTAGVQYMFGKMLPEADWSRAVSSSGLIATYTALFGNPLANPPADPIPASLVQPPLALPFGGGQTWYFTGGPHGGWGSGSAWAAVDFAPPDDPAQVSGPCYVSQYRVTAAAPGIIARSEQGTVMLDLDGDGNEATGWVVMYLHIDTQDRIEQGTRVEAGSTIGRPSCEGGVSNGTHAHVARLYNGEWVPASCVDCAGSAPLQPGFVMGGWEAVGLPGQEYQGYLINGDELRVAEAARGVAPNEISADA